MPDHKAVTGVCDFKIQIPAEILLTWFFASLYALLAQFAHQPIRHIIPEATWIDEIVFWFGCVKGRALKSDNSSDFRDHFSAGNPNSSQEPSARLTTMGNTLQSPRAYLPY